MIGGLASPPESHYNSPTIPSGSSEPQTLFSPNFSPPKFVDPRDLQYSMDVLQRHSQNNLMEQEIGSPMDKEEGSPMTGVEWRTLSLDPSSEDEEEGDPMVVESEKLSPELSEDEEEGDSMVVESEKLLPELSEDEEEGASAIGLESKRLASDSSEDEDEGISTKKSSSSDSLEDEDEGTHAKKSASEDEDEGHVEEGSPPFGLQPKNSSTTDVFENDLANVINGMTSNQTLLDQDSSVHLAASFEPRRSSRNSKMKNRPSLEFVTPSKSFSGKKMPAFTKDLILLQASLLIILCGNGRLNVL